MASFTDKPKIPLLGNSGSETYASFGTWKGSFSSALVRHGCGVYSSLDVSELPVAFPTDPKQATSSTTQQRYEETVAMFEGKFKILYLMIVSPGGPQLGRQNRHDIATWEVANQT